MQIIHHMTMDMAQRQPQSPICAMQGDGNTRLIRLTLLENGESWPVPQDITAAVAFHKPDGTKGLYDTLPNGDKAVTVDGNTVTAILAPQVLTFPGETSAAVVFHDSNLNQLATFPFVIRVKGNPAAGQGVSNDYYALQNLDQVNQAYTELLERMDALEQGGGGGTGGGSGGGISTTAITLLTDILKAAVFTGNVSGKIEALQEALLAGSSGDSGGGSGGVPDEPAVKDEITLTDGMLTIITVGSEVSVADGMMTIL